MRARRSSLTCATYGSQPNIGRDHCARNKWPRRCMKSVCVGRLAVHPGHDDLWPRATLTPTPTPSPTNKPEGPQLHKQDTGSSGRVHQRGKSSLVAFLMVSPFVCATPSDMQPSHAPRCRARHSPDTGGDYHLSTCCAPHSANRFVHKEANRLRLRPARPRHACRVPHWRWTGHSTRGNLSGRTGARCLA